MTLWTGSRPKDPVLVGIGDGRPHGAKQRWKAYGMQVWIDETGIEFDTSRADGAHSSVHCTQRHLDRLGFVHPGVIHTLIDETARQGASDSSGRTMVSVSNATTILRRVGPCRLVASGAPIHVDERQCLWRTDVKRSGQEGIVASGTVRLEPWDREAGQPVE